MTVRAMESPEWMELFVSCSLPSGLIRMLFPQDAKGTLLTEDPYPSSTAAVDKGAVTYLARRLSEQKTPRAASSGSSASSATVPAATNWPRRSPRRSAPGTATTGDAKPPSPSSLSTHLRSRSSPASSLSTPR